jgi:sulfate adenylyltransferase
MTSFECNPSGAGFTVFITGLSGSGKSTTAKELQQKLEGTSGRTITLLDGDYVRKHLSADLGFSREDRNENIRRVGHVAAEITKNGGIAICALIAPYDSARKAARQLVSSVGGFLLVYLSTPLFVCEARDQKGLYAKARAGTITQFTGISDPYEVPSDAELVLDTTTLSPDAAAGMIIQRLAMHRDRD